MPEQVAIDYGARLHALTPASRDHLSSDGTLWVELKDLAARPPTPARRLDHIPLHRLVSGRVKSKCGLLT